MKSCHQSGNWQHRLLSIQTRYQRAYRELEAEGYVYTVKGKGCFVAGVPEENTARKKELLKEIADASEELKFMGIQKDEVIAVIDKAWKI